MFKPTFDSNWSESEKKALFAACGPLRYWEFYKGYSNDGTEWWVGKRVFWDVELRHLSLEKLIEAVNWVTAS